MEVQRKPSRRPLPLRHQAVKALLRAKTIAQQIRLGRQHRIRLTLVHRQLAHQRKNLRHIIRRSRPYLQRHGTLLY